MFRKKMLQMVHYYQTMLNNNLLVNEKNVKGEIIRHPKGFWNFNQE